MERPVGKTSWKDQLENIIKINIKYVFGEPDVNVLQIYIKRYVCTPYNPQWWKPPGPCEARNIMKKVLNQMVLIFILLFSLDTKFTLLYQEVHLFLV